MSSPALPNRPRRWTLRLLRLAVALAALWVLFVAVRYHHVENRILRWWHDWHPDAALWERAQHWDGRSLWLPGYRFDIEARPVAGVDRNLSGMTYDRDRRELIAVINRPPEVLVLDTEGRVLRRHRIEGASDVEAIEYLRDGRIALLQEGRRSLLLVDMPVKDGAVIDARNVTAYPLALDDSGNNGPEGLAYDPATDTLYVAKERAPAALFALTGLMSGGPVVQTDQSAWLRHLPFATDLSALEWVNRFGHLLLLSDESQLLVELTSKGEPVSWRTLSPTRFHDLPAPQPEGLTMDDAGTLYVLSEPNLFYRLRPPAVAATVAGDD